MNLSNSLLTICYQSHWSDIPILLRTSFSSPGEVLYQFFTIYFHSITLLSSSILFINNSPLCSILQASFWEKTEIDWAINHFKEFLSNSSHICNARYARCNKKIKLVKCLETFLTTVTSMWKYFSVAMQTNYELHLCQILLEKIYINFIIFTAV